MSKALIFSIIVNVFFFFTMTTFAESIRTIRKDGYVYQKPDKDSQKIGMARRGKKVKVIEKKGAWSKLQFKNASGWIRNRYVMPEEKRNSSTKSVLDLKSGRSGKDNIVTTAGIRGLSKGDLKKARFSSSELNKLKNNRVSTAAAKSFAREANLTSR